MVWKTCSVPVGELGACRLITSVLPKLVAMAKALTRRVGANIVPDVALIREVGLKYATHRNIYKQAESDEM